MLRRTLVAAAATCLCALAPAVAHAQWAPADTATIHPGVQMYTDGAQCTGNFIFQDDADVYIGYAAHCAGTGAQTDTNGCTTDSLPLGTPVEIEGASQNGTLVYSSWLAMQGNGETDDTLCHGNDFALVRIDPADHGKVNPSVPFWGGPEGIGGTATGEKTYSYQNSSLRLGLEPLKPKTGVVTGSDGWSHNLYTVSPGIPGDSGSGFLNASGQALGVLSTLEALPRAGSNNISDVGRALAYAQANGFAGTALVNGTEPFSPIL